jgi:hypothetical protein
MSSEPQLGQRRKGGMLDIGDEDGSHALFYLPFTKRHYLGSDEIAVESELPVLRLSLGF